MQTFRRIALLPVQADAPLVNRGDGTMDARRDTQIDAGRDAEFPLDTPLAVGRSMRARAALTVMRDAAVSAALVTRELNDANYWRVCGLALSQAIEAELVGRWEPDVSVGDVMLSWDNVATVNFQSVRGLTPQQLFEMFRGTGLSHVVVVERGQDSFAYVKGLLSRSALAMRLGSAAHRTTSTNRALWGYLDLGAGQPIIGGRRAAAD